MQSLLSRIRLSPFVPFLNWITELRDRKVLVADAVAGITVALVLVPQSMAYAQLAGLPAYYGLYAAFMPPLVAALFGSSRQLATGPVAVVSLLTAAALEPIAASGTSGYIAYAIMLALMVGLFQLGLGLLRLGVVVNFLSHPVVLGFINAAAIIIATSQLDKIFGVRVEKAAYHYETVWNTLTTAMTQTHLPTLAFAVGAFVIMIAVRRLNPRLPNVLIAVIITTVAAYAIEFERKLTVKNTQFADKTVTNAINGYVRLGPELEQIDKDIASATTRLNDTAKKFGWNDHRTLAAQYRLDRIKLKRSRRVTSARNEINDIKRTRYVRATNDHGRPSTFYAFADAPEELESERRIWRISEILPDGDLIMNGGGRVVGAIPQGLPAPSWPKFDISIILQLISAAIAISLIGFIEAISIAKAMATKTRQHLDANQELIGQGLGNVVGSIFQSFPTSGSFSRSAVNIGAGALTGFSSIVTSLVVVVTLLWLTPLLYFVPQATLAAVIMLAVIGLINVRAVKHAWQANPYDGVVAIATFVLTLAFAPHLDKGILIGAGLALVLYLYRTMQPRIAILARHPDGTLRDAEVFGLQTCEEISMVRFDGSLYFANTNYFEDKILERIAAKPKLKFVIVVAEGINHIDATGEQMIAHLKDRLEKNEIGLLFAGVKKQVLDVFQRTGLYDMLGADHFFRTEHQALDYVWEKLGDNHAVDCPLNIVCQIPSPQRS